jgi:TetR/AcrR family transcriptional regulator
MRKLPQRDANRSRGFILDAAEDLFSRVGYEGVSLADIAALAGVSRGLPSYFFADKRSLYRTVMERAATQNRSAVLDVLRTMKGNQSAQILLVLVDRYIEYLAANPRLVRLLQWEALEGIKEPMSSGASGVPMRVFLEASRVISERLGRKRIKGLDVNDLLLSIVSMCLYPFQVMPQRDRKRRSFIQRHKRHVSAVVVRAVGGTT